MSKLPKLLAAAALLLCLSPFSTHAQTPPGAAPRRPHGAEGTHDFLGLGAVPDAAAAERGNKLFTSNCAFCHGIRANGGDSGPDLVRSALVLHDNNGNLIGPLVHSGRPDRGMPAFAGLTTPELADIAAFLHMRIELTANRGTYKLLDVVTGNAKAGDAYFHGQGGCATCHSTTGDLAHVGSKFSPPDLQQAFLYPSSKSNSSGATQKITVSLPSGEKLTGTVKHLDDFNVSLYDAAGAFHSLPITPGTNVELEDKLAAHRELLNHYTDADMHNVTAYLASLK